MIRYYPKINSPWHRFREGPEKNRFNFAAWSEQAFRDLEYNYWYWTSKWDGTCTGIHYPDPGAEVLGRRRYHVFGKSSKTVLEPRHERVLCEWAEEHFEQFEGSGLTIYGELVGPNIQSNRHGLPEGAFKPFDVRNAQGEWWDRSRVASVVGAEEPFVMTLDDVVQSFSAGISPPNVFDGMLDVSEGIVGTPNLLSLKGERIITKLKWKDFQ